MDSLTRTLERRERHCRDCGRRITLRQSRAGRWYAVDVIRMAHTPDDTALAQRYGTTYTTLYAVAPHRCHA